MSYKCSFVFAEGGIAIILETKYYIIFLLFYTQQVNLFTRTYTVKRRLMGLKVCKLRISGIERLIRKRTNCL